LAHRPIRVMHIIARLNVGGAALHVMLLAAEMRGAEFESSIVCGVVGADEREMRYVADARGVPVTSIPSLGREISLRRDLGTLLALYRLIRREQPDIVHTHTAKAGVVGRVAARLAGVRVVLHTFHGHVFSGYFSPRKTQLFLFLERACARLTTRIIVISAEIQRQIVETYCVCSLQKTVVVPIGFDLQQFAATVRGGGGFRAANAIPEGAPLVGIVGRMVPIKNHALFLDAAQAVHAIRPDVRFVLIGAGELRADIEAQVDRLGLRAVTTFVGWVTETAPVYAALNCLVLSSRNEGVPVSAIEAMAARVPVVSTDVGGVRDLINKPQFGYVVPPDDPSALARAILEALTTPLDLAAAQAHVMATYSAQTVAAAHGALYRELLAHAG